MIKHKKEFGVYHWDTFDNETWLVDEADTFKEAEDKIKSTYGARLSSNGADQVDIVNSKGIVKRSFKVC